jgi:hypothetical protein
MVNSAEANTKYVSENPLRQRLGLAKSSEFATTRGKYIHVGSGAASMPRTVVANSEDFSLSGDRDFRSRI